MLPSRRDIKIVKLENIQIIHSHNFVKTELLGTTEINIQIIHSHNVVKIELLGTTEITQLWSLERRRQRCIIVSAWKILEGTVPICTLKIIPYWHNSLGRPGQYQ